MAMAFISLAFFEGRGLGSLSNGVPCALKASSGEGGFGAYSPEVPTQNNLLQRMNATA